jgi:hypothetical protein
MISGVDDTFNFQQLGLTIFSNSEKAIQIPDWRHEMVLRVLALEDEE